MKATPPSIILPPHGEKGYFIAGETFRNLWQTVTGQKVRLIKWNGSLPRGNAVVIGSDAVNPAAFLPIRNGRMARFRVKYGTDDYHIISLTERGRTTLILAGACARSTIYAVYDFFRRKAGAEYFWDGDKIPFRPKLSMAGCDFAESPRFVYRGLRYFAHRGLHRFQAEHWDFEDWKREIDWILKKRLNLFMLRTGIDDLFQRVFPESCPYPPKNGPDPDAVPRSYDDRTSFWPLKYRGELRKKILQYASDRGLLHPEDTGTITHWYSHTPSSFYKHNPGFPVLKQNTPGYNSVTGRVWNIFDERAWQAYWKLTATHIREFAGKEPQLFHTIGLAERMFGKTRTENLNIKRYAYHKIQSVMREHYPDAPLLIASWDFIMNWKNADVKKLLREFDPSRTIILEYTADLEGRKPYRGWGIYRKFPWIFGVFHAFAPNSEIGGNYSSLAGRLREADSDPMCRGLALWPELSHGDTFMLEYLARNGWNPRGAALPASLRAYCASRYSAKIIRNMMTVWRDFFAFSRPLRWHANFRTRKSFAFLPYFRILSQEQFSNLTPERLALYRDEYAKTEKNLSMGCGVFKNLERLVSANYGDQFWRRDAIDIARTVLDQFLRWTFVKIALNLDAWRKDKALADTIRLQRRQIETLLALLGNLLDQDPDFSIYASLQRLARTAPVNSHAEQTLKGNIENDYCRTFASELVRHVYKREFEVYFNWIERRLAAGGRKAWRRPAEQFDAEKKRIQDEFYATPLKSMAPRDERSAKQLRKIFRQCGEILAAT
ncbi:MAG: alpha-N-acetylglucosaminidase TIM-barrel domain-containing protein [Kiritimatiellae bacterium]|nr:alpha-N-acetylglucosaminidase TIM-barrel domain-containing protein [Kiritimatiellia bacterium]